MPNWVVECPKCKHSFPYWKINSAIDEIRQDGTEVGIKPTIEPQGDQAKCPYCKTTSTFRSSDLTFSYA